MRRTRPQQSDVTQGEQRLENNAGGRAERWECGGPTDCPGWAEACKHCPGGDMPLELMMEGNLLNQFYMDHEALKNTLLLARSKGCRALCREVPGSQCPGDRRRYG